MHSGHQVRKVLPTPEHCLVVMAHTERGISKIGSSMPPCSVGRLCSCVKHVVCGCTVHAAGTEAHIT